MIIGMACTRNWYTYMAVVLYSIMKHNKVEKAYLFIEDDTIPFLNDNRLEFINVNKLPDYIKNTSPNYLTHYTKMTFARCYFTKVLKCDRILYIDTDTLIVDNLDELWNINLENNVIAGVHEGGEWDKYLGETGFDDKYINVGVMLMDLKKLREEHLDDQILEIINTKRYFLPDQDSINLVCKDRIKHIPNIYNSTETTGFVDNAKILHYIRERKGWVKGSPRSEIWYQYFNDMIKKGEYSMEENYKVRALKTFNDYMGKPIVEGAKHEQRIAGQSEWYCTEERYEFLKSVGAVEFIEKKAIELPKIEEKKEEVKKISTRRKTTKK